MASYICSSFRTFTPQRNHINKSFRNWLFSHRKNKESISFTLSIVVCSSLNDDSNSPSPNSKISEMSYDPSEDLFGVYADLQPRKPLSSGSTPRSWFGPNGQYIRELPCPSCRGRGYTSCKMCGIERSRLDCSQCNGKGMVTCHQCAGECVIWEESIDERPWEKARSISPLKVKEDDEVDNLEIKLSARKKSKRVYQSPSPEVCLKISRSLKSLNAKTGLFTNRMKIIHGDPELHAQRVAAIKKSKGSADARKRASESMKAFFSDPGNRLKRSISMKGVNFFCKNCGREGHRKHYCPELDQNSPDRQLRCSLCGEKGHNRRSCRKDDKLKSEEKSFKQPCCSICGKPGHNRRTCLQQSMTTAPPTRLKGERKIISTQVKGNKLDIKGQT
ncbi:hypothetical protein SSX86_007284 [Deinandra increscens subsp. villosa]|uniref:CCHC-type domain-containing protein n=1 Tax=Deinandra increscens subsp. villosa TaxID=3103831 RepID=A0AAP0H7C3_9ASTR